MTAVLNPRATVTADNYGPAVSVITWILIVSAVLGVLLKVGLGVSARVPIGSDDATLIFATVLSVAQSIAVSIQISNGIGRHRDSLTVAQIERFEKAEYAASLLFIASLATSKVSVLVLLRRITPFASHRSIILAMGAFIASWTVASLFASAFRCSLPNAWRILHKGCFNQISFWISYACLNLITEVALIGLPTKIVWNVHISRRRKFVVIGCFAARLAVIGPIIAQLIQLTGLRRSTTDITFDSWPYYISNQLVLNLSVLTVCVPSIKNFLIGLESGMIQTGDFHLRKTTGTTSANSGSITNPTTASSCNNNNNNNNTHHANLPPPRAALTTIKSDNVSSENEFTIRSSSGGGGGGGGKQTSFDDSHSINNADTVGFVLPPTHTNNIAVPVVEEPSSSSSSSGKNANWDWDDDGTFANNKRKIVRTTEWRVDYQQLS